MAIDGVYNIEVSSPMGKQTSKLTLKTSGDTLTGIDESSFGAAELDGTVNGDEFKFEEEVSSPMGKMKITGEGKVEGDKISGTMKSTFGAMPFEGTRA